MAKFAFHRKFLHKSQKPQKPSYDFRIIDFVPTFFCQASREKPVFDISLRFDSEVFGISNRRRVMAKTVTVMPDVCPRNDLRSQAGNETGAEVWSVPSIIGVDPVKDLIAQCIGNQYFSGMSKEKTYNWKGLNGATRPMLHSHLLTVSSHTEIRGF